MPPKKPQAGADEPKVPPAPPPGVSEQLWEVSKDIQALVAKLKGDETQEDIEQGCSKAQVCTSFSYIWIRSLC